MCKRVRIKIPACRAAARATPCRKRTVIFQTALHVPTSRITMGRPIRIQQVELVPFWLYVFAEPPSTLNSDSNNPKARRLQCKLSWLRLGATGRA